MKKILLFFLLTICVQPISRVLAQMDGKVTLSREILKKADDSLSLKENWKYHTGDNAIWANPEYDDSDWETVSTELKADALPQEGWTGIGWFRLHVEVDSSLWDQPLALVYSQHGAAEIYLDGNLIYTYGRVGSSKENEKDFLVRIPTPLFFSFNKKTDHVIAVRYSNFLAGHFHRLDEPAGFGISLGDLNKSIERRANRIKTFTRFRILFTGLSLAFAFLHLMIFFFYPRSKENLYYSVFVSSLTIIQFIDFQSSFLIDPEWFFFFREIWSIAIVLTSIFGIRFVYGLFYTKLPKQFWILLAGGIFLGVVSWIIPVLYIYLFGLVSLAELLRVVLVAILKKKEGARIIGIGSIVFIIALTYQILLEIHILKVVGNFEVVYQYGVLSFLISMSIYLARNFAQTNKNLETQFIQVKELSAKTLEQERQAKEQEIKQKLLEAEVEHQAKELEGTRKLQKALADLEKAHSHLRETQDQLVQSEKMASLGMLVAGIAHEINNPVGAIQSMHDTLMRTMKKLKSTLVSEFPKECGENLRLNELLKIIEDSNKVIESGTHRVTHIVQKLRSFARLDEAEMQKSDIQEGIEDTLTIVHHEIKNRIKVIKNYGKIPKIFCYPGQLNQVFLNLLINASQAIKEKGEITVSTYQKDGKVYVEIVDDGVGIPREHIKKIFDPGFTTKGVGVGTGLGLSICYQIIQNHRGVIKVESEVGKGSKFTVILPMDLNEKSEIPGGSQ